MKVNSPLVLFFALCFFPFGLSAQIQSANDGVPAIPSAFLFGVNPGYYDGWDDEGLADIGFGNSDKGITGAGLQTLRGYLPEWFLEQWGYDIRVDEYEYFESLGGKEFTVTIGYPAEEHRENISYCPGEQSEVFENLYLPIWDNGENGTPVNDENYYALYIYEMVSRYQQFIKIYEVWNEPDYDLSGNGFKDPGEPGNWWENIPAPCDTRLKAPIFSYIRMLRIAYEVIKSEDPSALIAVGGLGYPSYLDLICRHTDNPVDGSVNATYPLTGGAWFDVLSYHSYPHFDGSMRDWSNDINDFVYFRHSDAAVKGLYDKKAEFETVLANYKYNDNTFPKKHFITTESNIPRVAFDEYLGSNDAQVNYLMKAIIMARKNGLRQFHAYKQAEDKLPGQYGDSFDAMGLFENLDGVPMDEYKITDAGIACATVTQLLGKAQYSEEMTASLNLPANIGGAVFTVDSNPIYTLWAKTTIDQSEEAQASFDFQEIFPNNEYLRIEWDYSNTGNVIPSPLSSISNLTTRPSIFSSGVIPAVLSPTSSIQAFFIKNNPGIQPSIHWSMNKRGVLYVRDIAGQLIYKSPVDVIGQFDFSMLVPQVAAGSYLVQLITEDAQRQAKIIWLAQ